MEFNLPKEQSSIIKVIGVGGGGCNAVNYMYNQGIKGVNFVVCNTDAQSLESSTVPNPIQLGPELTEGLGAGSRPEVGRKAAEESIREIKDILEKKTKMVFITAGLGGGTGTGAAPLIAETAKSMGILTVSIVTTPFSFEGRRKIQQAMAGLEELKKHSDAYIIISNDKLREIYKDMTKTEAFAQADNVLATAARSIAEIITIRGSVNTDFADVDYVMRDSGMAIMGSALTSGEDRAINGVKEALSSPLLSENDIRGARSILLNITSGKNEIRLQEIDLITNYLEAQAGDCDVIMGVCEDDTMEDEISVTVIATGFEQKKDGIFTPKEEPKNNKIVLKLDEENKVEEHGNPNYEDVNPVLEEKQSTKNQFSLELGLFDHNDSIENDNSDAITFDFDEVNKTNENDFQVREINDEEKSAFGHKENEEKQIEEKRNYQISASTDIRKNHLSNLSLKINRGSARIEDLENEPAYKRKGINPSTVPHSSEESVYSRFTLDDSDEDGKPKFNINNSFLHDNID